MMKFTYDDLLVQSTTIIDSYPLIESIITKFKHENTLVLTWIENFRLSGWW